MHNTESHREDTKFHRGKFKIKNSVINKIDSKIILITGATQGIGKETALTLAKHGHRVIIFGRNKEK